MTYLDLLEAEGIHIIREVVAECKNPVLLYSVGKDSSVLVHLARKAFHPAPLPFPLLHVDTGYKFPEMYEFRDAFTRQIGARLIVARHEEWLARGAHPRQLGPDVCCRHLKTEGLLQALRQHEFDAAFGGARREEEKSRAKERIFSVRDEFGQWDPKNQRPEPWDLYNTRLAAGQSVRVFPLSNWTELDIWHYIARENLPVVPMYFARRRPVIRRQGILIPVHPAAALSTAEQRQAETVLCRFRSLGCIPCTGAVESDATTVAAVIAELRATRRSERENRIIDLTGDAAMEQKKREGYF